MKTEIKTAFLIIPFALTALLLSLGCGNRADERADAGCEDALCIGVLLQTTELRYSMIKAAKFARDDINRAGGNVKLIMGDVATPLASARELLDMGARAIIGPGTSGNSVKIFDFLVENELVAVSPSATSVTLTENNQELIQARKTPFFFRTVPTDSFQAKILVDQAQNEGEVLIVHRGDNYGVKLTELINEELRSQNRPTAKVVNYELYDSDDPDFDEKTQDVLEDIKAVSGIGDVGSIIMVVSEGEGEKIIKGMLDSPVVPSTAKYYVSDSLAVANLHELVDPDNPAEVEGFKSTTPCALPDPPERKDEFEKRFDLEEFPSLQFTVHTYDAVVAVALAALSAGSEDPSGFVSEMAEVTGEGNRCLSYAECAAALTDKTAANDNINYEGVSGPIDFDENGDIGAGCYSVYTYDAEGGRTRQIFSIPDLEKVDVSEPQPGQGGSLPPQPRPDIAPLGVFLASGGTLDGGPGRSFTFRSYVRNSGDAEAPATTLCFYRSVERSIEPTDTLVGSVAVGPLAASGGTSSELLLSLPAPTRDGTYYYGACVDAVAGESDTTNNCTLSLTVTVDGPPPDLTVGRASVTEVREDETSWLGATVRNQGAGGSAAATVRYKRSTDATITTSDTELHTGPVNRLSLSGTSEATVVLTAPETPGTYYYGACVDAVPRESDTNNNCSVSVRVEVGGPPPDLVVLAPSVSAINETYPLDGTFSLVVTVRNQGGGTAAAATVRYKRSTDATITTSDTTVGTDEAPTLISLAGYVATIKLTAPSTPGTYYYGVCVDPVHRETDTTNNCSSAASPVVN